MATSKENPRRRTTTNENVGSTASETIQQNSVPPPNEPVQYKNAREYAQVLRPWLWQYHTMVTMQQFLTLCPPPFFQSCHFSTNQPGVSSPNFQQQQPSHQPARPAQGQTQVNGHAPTPHIFPGKKLDEDDDDRNQNDFRTALPPPPPFRKTGVGGGGG